MTRPVHPIADLFPMMTDEELADLAADIKANGLLHPIVVDKEGALIDGRNRARACEIAGVEPTIMVFDGDDPRAFILAMNIKRRHMVAVEFESVPVESSDSLRGRPTCAGARDRPAIIIMQARTLKTLSPATRPR